MTKKRVITYGNDLFQTLACPNGKVVAVTFWDLWIIMVVVEGFNGDWDALSNQLISSRYGRDLKEGMLHHVKNLRITLADNDVFVLNYYNDLDKDFIRKQKRKSSSKIIELGFREKEKSSWMINTPRKEKMQFAMRGHWGQFPVSPDSFAKEIARTFIRTFYSKDQSLTLQDNLFSKMEKMEKKKTTPELLALYRAGITVVLEKIESVDDSYGVMGDFCQTVFEKYINLDRTEISLSSDNFYGDIVDLLIWEDYGFLDTSYSSLFSTVSIGDVTLVENLLNNRRVDLCKLDMLAYQAEKPLTFLGELYKSQLMYDKFPGIAALMGTRSWERITSMAALAEKKKKYDVAMSVYDACLRPGFHEKYLKKEFEKLKRNIKMDA